MCVNGYVPAHGRERRAQGGTMSTQQRTVVRALLQRHGTTYAEEIGIRLGRGGPSPLFRLLCAALLLSARISADIAVAAARALADHGWTTPRKLADATWAERTRVLNRAGYARYDERTSRMLEDTARHLLDAYGGDLRRLRDAAERDPEQERRLLKEFKGIGDVGADIFLREVQRAWPELRPFFDRRALASARRLKLPAEPEELAALAPRGDTARLAAALVRAGLAKDHRAILSDADA
jgi:endonuclease III